MVIIAVDFDNTLMKSEDGILSPLDGAREAMKALRQRGYKIVVHTCRIGLAISSGRVDAEIAFIRQSLRDHDIEYDEIFIGEKLIADLYIDDRAISFAGDWRETVSDTLRLVNTGKQK